MNKKDNNNDDLSLVHTRGSSDNSNFRLHKKVKHSIPSLFGKRSGGDTISKLSWLFASNWYAFNISVFDGPVDDNDDDRGDDEAYDGLDTPYGDDDDEKEEEDDILE